MESEFNFFSEDGAPLNPELLIKPGLCITCVNDEDELHSVLCTLNRFDQIDENEFICHAYRTNN